MFLVSAQALTCSLLVLGLSLSRLPPRPPSKFPCIREKAVPFTSTSCISCIRLCFFFVLLPSCFYFTGRSNGAYEPPSADLGHGVSSRRRSQIPSLYVEVPRSATQRAMRPDPLSDMTMMDMEDTQSRRSVPDDYPESLAGSVSTLSSQPASPATSNRSPVFGPAMYQFDHEQHSDSVDVWPQGRQTLFDSQYHDLTNRTNQAKAPLPKLSLERPQSLNLPLRIRKDSPNEEKTSKHLKRATTYITDRASSVNSRRPHAPAFDLMPPPPGRRRSLLDETTSLMNIKPYGSCDADPSEALASRIAASILREGYGVQAPSSTVPLKVQDAVGRCLQEVSTTVRNEHPQWALPTYYADNTRSSTPSSDSDQFSDFSGSKNRKRTSHNAGDEDRNLFRYDQAQDGRQRRGSGGHRNLDQRRKAKALAGPESYPCPFRRRNPVMFNVRDHEHCAKRPFSDLLELKRHIRTYHRRVKSPYYCLRCKKGFPCETDLSEHLMVPVEQMCEAVHVSSTSAEEGITEEMDRVLADQTRRIQVQTWEEIWRLLFPGDSAALDPEFQPVVEMVEMEQELDDSQAELKSDLSESLKRLLPDQPEDVCFFLAGQFQLVFDQHRAKVNRKCQHNAGSSGTRTSIIEKNKGNPSRFSVRSIGGTAQGANHQVSTKFHKQRQSQVQPIPLITNRTPSTSSSVYSTNSNLQSSNNNSKPPTRSSTFSMNGIQVESPRLPFKDWVEGIRFNKNSENSQRDSGLAMEQCEVCKMEPCNCESYAGYADQLSAFMTPAAPQASDHGMPTYSMTSQGGDDREDGWTAQYGANMPSAVGMPLSGSAVEA